MDNKNLGSTANPEQKTPLVRLCFMEQKKKDDGTEFFIGNEGRTKYLIFPVKNEANTGPEYALSIGNTDNNASANDGNNSGRSPLVRLSGLWKTESKKGERFLRRKEGNCVYQLFPIKKMSNSPATHRLVVRAAAPGRPQDTIEKEESVTPTSNHNGTWF